MKKEYCFYCDAKITKVSSVGDHFPISKMWGGKITVPCCESCHDMKDRVLLEDWPVSWCVKIIDDFPKLSRETRLFLAKLIRLMPDIQKRSIAKKIMVRKNNKSQYSLFRDD